MSALKEDEASLDGEASAMLSAEAALLSEASALLGAIGLAVGREKAAPAASPR